MRWLAVPAALHMNARIFMKPLLDGVRLRPGGEPRCWRCWAVAEAALGRLAGWGAAGGAGHRQRQSCASPLFYSDAPDGTGGHVPAHPVVTQLAMIYWPPMALQDGRASL